MDQEKQGGKRKIRKKRTWNSDNEYKPHFQEMHLESWKDGMII